MSLFSDRVMAVVGFADRAAGELGHREIGTGHLLLGLLQENADLAGVVGVGPDVTHARLVEFLGASDRPEDRVVALVGRPPRLPIGAAAKKGMELGLQEAAIHDARAASPEHVLLGLTRDSNETTLLRILESQGIDRETVRANVVASLGLRSKPPTRAVLERRLDRIAILLKLAEQDKPIGGVIGHALSANERVLRLNELLAIDAPPGSVDDRCRLSNDAVDLLRTEARTVAAQLDPSG